MKLIQTDISKQGVAVKMPVKPTTIHKELDKRLAGLDEAKRFISTRIALHLRRALDLSSNNAVPGRNQCLLILGPSGSGKTFLVEQAAAIARLPFVSASAASLTEAGYVGQNLGGVLHMLMKTATSSKLARYGICFLDEWDKRVQQRHEKAGFNQGVQGEILKMMEGTVVEIETRPVAGKTNPKFDTKGLMFVFAGAFEGLDQLVGEMPGKRVSGFAPEGLHQPARENKLREALLAYGIIPEFINRLSGILTLPAPTPGDLVELLKFGNGPIESCNKMLRGMGAELVIHEQAAQSLANYACETKSYCRGMQMVLQAAVDHLVYEDIKGQVEIEPSDMKRLVSGKRLDLSPLADRPPAVSVLAPETKPRQAATFMTAA